MPGEHADRSEHTGARRAAVLGECVPAECVLGEDGGALRADTSLTPPPQHLTHPAPRTRMHATARPPCYNVLTTKAAQMTILPHDLLDGLESQRVAIRAGLDDIHRAALDASLSETDREFAAIRQRHEEMIAQMFRKR